MDRWLDEQTVLERGRRDIAEEEPRMEGREENQRKTRTAFPWLKEDWRVEREKVCGRLGTANLISAPGRLWNWFWLRSCVTAQRLLWVFLLRLLPPASGSADPPPFQGTLFSWLPGQPISLLLFEGLLFLCRSLTYWVPRSPAPSAPPYVPDLPLSELHAVTFLGRRPGCTRGSRGHVSKSARVPQLGKCECGAPSPCSTWTLPLAPR